MIGIQTEVKITKSTKTLLFTSFCDISLIFDERDSFSKDFVIFRVFFHLHNANSSVHLEYRWSICVQTTEALIKIVNDFCFINFLRALSGAGHYCTYHFVSRHQQSQAVTISASVAKRCYLSFNTSNLSAFWKFLANHNTARSAKRYTTVEKAHQHVNEQGDIQYATQTQHETRRR